VPGAVSEPSVFVHGVNPLENNFVNFIYVPSYRRLFWVRAMHPLNRNAWAKTQSGQQLQILRDKGLVRFVGRGRYRMMGSGGVL
jgi:Dam-replacing HTH domain